jgi:hypothetical protein
LQYKKIFLELIEHTLVDYDQIMKMYYSDIKKNIVETVLTGLSITLNITNAVLTCIVPLNPWAIASLVITAIEVGFDICELINSCGTIKRLNSINYFYYDYIRLPEYQDMVKIND